MAGFWRGRRVVITGHTGFKGAWLTFFLSEWGAELAGLALPPATQPNMHDILDIPSRGRFVHCDVNDRAALVALLRDTKPEVIIHMAAQALVRFSYSHPFETFATNVLGTVTLLEAVREFPQIRAVLVVTSDKAYENQESARAYRETDVLGGHDPYSASKACAEIAVAAMRRSFFGPGGHPARIATARAGNVIGGGDWSADRLIPDIVRGCLGAEGIVRLRNPAAIRPWQHVLEPLTAYLLLAERLCTADGGMDQAWNFGPDVAENRSVSEVAKAIVAALGRGRIELVADPNAPHEAHLLTLDCAKAYDKLGWRSRLDFDAAVSMTADWYAAWARGENMTTLTRRQIAAFTAAAL